MISPERFQKLVESLDPKYQAIIADIDAKMKTGGITMEEAQKILLSFPDEVQDQIKQFMVETEELQSQPVKETLEALPEPVKELFIKQAAKYETAVLASIYKWEESQGGPMPLIAFRDISEMTGVPEILITLAGSSLEENGYVKTYRGSCGQPDCVAIHMVASLTEEGKKFARQSIKEKEHFLQKDLMDKPETKKTVDELGDEFLRGWDEES